MPTAPKTKPATMASAEGQPWIKQGITYQQWHYRNRKKPAVLQKHSNLNGGEEAMVTAEEASRDKILMLEYLDRFEAQPPTTPMTISFGMALSLYNTLRADGH